MPLVQVVNSTMVKLEALNSFEWEALISFEGELGYYKARAASKIIMAGLLCTKVFLKSSCSLKFCLQNDLSPQAAHQV